MFKCKKCNSIDKFELMFNPAYKGSRNFEITKTKQNDIQINVDGYTFIPDIYFMNNHAVCKHCGNINCWDYNI